MIEQQPFDFTDPGPARPHGLEARFRQWLASADGQAVFRAVIDRGLALRRAGFEHYGIAALWESIRYDRAVQLGPASAEPYRLNNSYRSRLAREVMERCSELSGFFGTRELR